MNYTVCYNTFSSITKVRKYTGFNENHQQYRIIWKYSKLNTSVLLINLLSSVLFVTYSHRNRLLYSRRLVRIVGS